MPGPIDSLLRRAGRRAASLPSRHQLDWIAHHSLFRLAHDESLDAELRARIAGLERDVEARNRALLWRCEDILDALDGLDVVPLKGVYFLDTIYADRLGERVLSDIDLMVPEPQIEDALSRLASRLGYRETRVSLKTHRFQPHRRVEHDGLALELHNKLTIKHIGSSDWTTVAPIAGSFLGRELQVLDDATQLVYLVSHLVKHGPFYSLKWVIDIVLWLERCRPDPQLILERARSLRAEVVFVAGIRALRSLLGAACFAGFPSQPRRLGGRGRVRLNEATVWRATYRNPMDTSTADSSWKRNLAALLLVDSGVDSARFLALKTSEHLRRALG